MTEPWRSSRGSQAPSCFGSSSTRTRHLPTCTLRTSWPCPRPPRVSFPWAEVSLRGLGLGIRGGRSSGRVLVQMAQLARHDPTPLVVRRQLGARTRSDQPLAGRSLGRPSSARSPIVAIRDHRKSRRTSSCPSRKELTALRCRFPSEHSLSATTTTIRPTRTGPSGTSLATARDSSGSPEDPVDNSEHEPEDPARCGMGSEDG